MAEQATGTVESTDAAGTLAHGSPHMEHNPGRPVSWIGVGIVIVGLLGMLISYGLAALERAATPWAHANRGA